jgi:hypothetical protein
VNGKTVSAPYFTNPFTAVLKFCISVIFIFESTVGVVVQDIVDKPIAVLLAFASVIVSVKSADLTGLSSRGCMEG